MPEADRGSIHVTRRRSDTPAPTGTRPAYLLVHGTMDRATSFGRIGGLLTDGEVIAYDRRGYAGSAGRAPSTHFEDQVDDLFEVIDNQPVVAFGHSFGGTVVLGAASRRPDLVVAAVIWEAPMPWLPWWPDATPGRAASRNSRPPEDVAESFMRRMVGDRIWERLPAATRAQRRAEGPALVAEMLALNSGVLWDPTTIGIPVVVGRGGTSSERHRRAAQDLAAALPRGQLVDVEGANHGAHLSHPRVMAELLHRAAEAMPLVRTDPS